MPRREREDTENQTAAEFDPSVPTGTPDNPDTEGFNSDLQEDDEASMLSSMGEFDIENEFKPDPLVANGNYYGNVIETKFKKDKNCISFKVCLDGNGGVMSDGVTPIDGSHHFYNIWLPKPGDENEMESNGRVTKRQGKINRMKKIADGLKIDLNHPRAILEAISNQEWIGLSVICQMKISEYNGQFRNEIDRMTAQPQQ